jgi:hypothetical protein
MHADGGSGRTDLAVLARMRHSITRVPVALLLVLLAAPACSDGASRHASDGDTGAAAPATQRDMSETQSAPSGGSNPAAVARNDSVRARSTGGPGALTTKSSNTPAIKPEPNP